MNASMMTAPHLLLAWAVSGCAATPGPQAEATATPVIDLDDQGDGTAKAGQGKRQNEQEKMAKVRAAAIATALAELEVTTLGRLSDGADVAGVLTAGEVPAGLLDDTVASSGGLKLAGGSGAAAGGGGHITTIGPGSTTSGAKAPVKGPKGTASLSASVTQSKVANAASVVARMRGRFRRCYQQGLNSDPSLAGTVTLVGSIGPKGEVVSVTGGPTTSLKAIVPCLKAVMASGGFAPPDGGSAEVSVTATFRALAP